MTSLAPVLPRRPDVLWIADLTYLRTWEGWLYLAAVQDAYSRRIVGWSMADHMRQELVIDALNMAVNRRRPKRGADPPFRPGIAVCRSGVRTDVRQVRDLALDGIDRRLLGQGVGFIVHLVGMVRWVRGRAGASLGAL